MERVETIEIGSRERVELVGIRACIEFEVEVLPHPIVVLLSPLLLLYVHLLLDLSHLLLQSLHISGSVGKEFRKVTLSLVQLLALSVGLHRIES